MAATPYFKGRFSPFFRSFDKYQSRKVNNYETIFSDRAIHTVHRTDGR